METNLTIDRSELADTAQADKLAALLIQQLEPQLPTLLPLPIEDVARACGILEIKSLTTEGFEGGLIQDEHKELGYILVKDGVNKKRRRFTVAHELGHFVNLRHVAPMGSEQLLCNKEHLRAVGTGANSRHGIEAQANEFAANILMPANKIKSQQFMKGSAEMCRILSLQELCEVSKEAAARRYAELHGDDFAVVFSRDGRFIYAVRGGDFPYIDLRKDNEIYRHTVTRTFKGSHNDISDQEESDSTWWLDERNAKKWELWEEVLVQEDGFRMTLLVGDQTSDD